jgi:hypothetical protein
MASDLLFCSAAVEHLHAGGTMLPRIRITSLCVTLAAAASLGCRSDARLPLEPDASPIAGAVDPCNPDVVPPSVSSVSASPNVLWPPNHKMMPVAVAVAASDNCSAITSRIVGVTSNEPVNALGDGNTDPDWVVTGPLALLLRTERSGTGTGRVYTITVESNDVTGNKSTAFTSVLVPHDQGN